MYRIALIALMASMSAMLGLASAAAYEVDDVVVVIKNAKLRETDKVVGSVERGDILWVEDIDGKLLWVRTDGTPGWLDSRHVLSLDDGLRHFSDAIQRNANDNVAYRARAAIWREKDEYDKALGDCNQALRIIPNDGLAYGIRATVWFHKEDYDRSIQDFNEALRLKPQDAKAHLYRGVAWGIKGEFDKAIADFNEAIRLKPDDVFAYSFRGGAWSSKGEHEKAIEDFSEAIRLDPSDARIHQFRGEAWAEQGEHDKAIEDYTQVIRIDPSNAEAYFNRGDMRHMMGEFDKAIEDYTQLIRLDPNNAWRYNNRGHIWVDKGEYDKALADFTQAIRLEPNNAEFYYLRGLMWNRNHDYEEAIKDLGEAVRLEPEDSNIHSMLALVLTTCPDEKVRDGENAVKHATLACELTGWKDAMMLSILAAAYAQSGEFEKAIEWQTKALKVAPEAEAVFYQCWLDLFRAGKPLLIEPTTAGRTVDWHTAAVASDEEQREINAFFQFIRDRMQRDEYAELKSIFAWDRTLREIAIPLRWAGFSGDVERQRVVARLMLESWMPKKMNWEMSIGILTTIRNLGLRRPWDVRPARISEDRQEAVVVVRHRADNHRSHYQRWWLVRRDGKWRLFDMADFSSGVRISEAFELGLTVERAGRAELVQALEQFSLAEAAAAQGDLETLQEVLDQIPEGDYPDVLQFEIEKLRAALAMQTGELAEALQHLDRVEQLRPGVPFSSYSRAACYIDLGRYEEALPQAHMCLEQLGADAERLWLLGTALAGLGRDEEAAHAFRKGLDDTPSYVNNLIGLGLALPSEKKAEIAEHLVRVENAEQQMDKLAGAFLAKEDLEAVLALVSGRRQTAPDDPKVEYYQAVVFHRRGNAWAKKGEYDKAIDDYTRAIQLDPNHAYAYYHRGYAWSAKADYGRAIDDYNHDVRLRPTAAEAHNRLAWLLATCPDAKFRDGQRAVEHATRACELTEWSDANNLDTLAAAYAEAGQVEKAFEWQTRAVEIAPEDQKANYRSRIELYRTGKPSRE